MTELEEFRKEKDDFFATHPQSPLTDEQKKNFQGLNYFPENPGLSLEVDLAPFPERQMVQMLTSTNDIQTYQRFGRIHFQVEGQDAELTIYAKDGELFLPFVDSLAGEETYGAGRYLEPQPLGKGRVLVDFNYAYNPYCAYNELWSCPLTPAENRLKVPIRAGERVFRE
ncbi:MAG TPA: DUF1684 domain-containing protein [Anaerolineaceae bacterium]|nr:DUF1684 domain-containing protein [Anaerolineaceae bacterium]